MLAGECLYGRDIVFNDTGQQIYVLTGECLYGRDIVFNDTGRQIYVLTGECLYGLDLVFNDTGQQIYCGMSYTVGTLHLMICAQWGVGTCPLVSQVL